MKLARAVAAALFVAGSTCALAQTSSQSVDPRVPQKNPSDSMPPPPPPSATTPAPPPRGTTPQASEGTGSRPMGPPSANDPAGSDNDKNTTDLRKLDKQGRTGGN